MPNQGDRDDCIRDCRKCKPDDDNDLELLELDEFWYAGNDMSEGEHVESL